MRKLIAFLGAIALLALARPATAQQLSTSFGSTLMGPSLPSTSTGNVGSVFSSAMAKPGFSAVQTKPTIPTPLNFNMSTFLPTLPNLQNTMLLRNLFGGPQSVTTMPSRQVPPPPKKKN